MTREEIIAKRKVFDELRILGFELSKIFDTMKIENYETNHKEAKAKLKLIEKTMKEI